VRERECLTLETPDCVLWGAREKTCFRVSRSLLSATVCACERENQSPECLLRERDRKRAQVRVACVFVCVGACVHLSVSSVC